MENLPNEIILEIFEYLDVREIYHGFYELNQRLNILVQSFDRFYFIENTNDSSAINWILSNPNLRLRYCSIPNFNLQTILTSMPSIEVFKIGSIDFVMFNKLLIMCPNIRLLEFSFVDNSITSIDFNSNLNLRYLTIKNLPFKIPSLDVYLARVPNLKILTIHFIQCSENQLPFLFEINWLVLENLHRIVYYLSIAYDESKSEMYDYIIRQIEHTVVQQTNTKLIIENSY